MHACTHAHTHTHTDTHFDIYSMSSIAVLIQVWTNFMVPLAFVMLPSSAWVNTRPSCQKLDKCVRIELRGKDSIVNYSPPGHSAPLLQPLPAVKPIPYASCSYSVIFPFCRLANLQSNGSILAAWGSLCVHKVLPEMHAAESERKRERQRKVP